MKLFLEIVQYSCIILLVGEGLPFSRAIKLIILLWVLKRNA